MTRTAAKLTLNSAQLMSAERWRGPSTGNRRDPSGAAACRAEDSAAESGCCRIRAAILIGEVQGWTPVRWWRSPGLASFLGESPSTFGVVGDVSPSGLPSAVSWSVASGDGPPPSCVVPTRHGCSRGVDGKPAHTCISHRPDGGGYRHRYWLARVRRLSNPATPTVSVAAAGEKKDEKDDQKDEKHAFDVPTLPTLQPDGIAVHWASHRSSRVGGGQLSPWRAPWESPPAPEGNCWAQPQSPRDQLFGSQSIALVQASKGPGLEAAPTPAR